jgi:hypothetical protein
MSVMSCTRRRRLRRANGTPAYWKKASPRPSPSRSPAATITSARRTLGCTGRSSSNKSKSGRMRAPPHATNNPADPGGRFGDFASHDVATYIEQLQTKVSAPSVKQQLGAACMLFDWLVIGQVVPGKSGLGRPQPDACREDRQDSGTRGRRVAQAARLHPCHDLSDLRDRALIATLTYSFARIRARKTKVEDLRPHGAAWTIRLHEKGGKQHSMPCHHALAEGVARLHRRRRCRRGPQGLAIPHCAGTTAARCPTSR